MVFGRESGGARGARVARERAAALESADDDVYIFAAIVSSTPTPSAQIRRKWRHGRQELFSRKVFGEMDRENTRQKRRRRLM